MELLAETELLRTDQTLRAVNWKQVHILSMCGSTS